MKDSFPIEDVEVNERIDLSDIFSNFDKTEKTPEEINTFSRHVEEEVSRLSEEDYWNFIKEMGSNDSLLMIRHYLDDNAVRSLIGKGFTFSEMHLGPKFGVQDFIDIDSLKLMRLSHAVKLQGEFVWDGKRESMNDKAFRETLALAPTYKGVADKFISQLGIDHTIRPDIFIREMAKATANPEIDEYQKTALIDSFEYIYSLGGDRYDEALADGLVFDDPKRYTETGYFLNLLSSAHGISKHGPDFSKGVSHRIEENLRNALAKPDGSYFLRTRARQVLTNIEDETYEKSNDFEPFFIAPGKQGVFTEHGLKLLDEKGKEKRLEATDISVSSLVPSNLDIADFEFFERPYMRNIFEKEFGISVNEMTLPEQFQYLTFLKSKSEAEVDKVKDFTKKFGVTGMRTFLSLEYGRDFGDKIIEMGEKLSEEDAKMLFQKYAEIVDSADKAVLELDTAFTDETKNKGEIVTKVRDNLLRYGRKLLENFSDNLQGDNSKKDIQILMAQLSQTRADIVLSAVVFKALSNEGMAIEEIANMNIETQAREDFRVEDKDEMKRIFHENRGEYPEDLRTVTESEFNNILETGHREFHVLRRGEDIIAFARFDELPNGNLYIGSLNVRPEIKSLTVGGTFLADLIRQKNKDYTLEAEAYSQNKMLKNYTDKFGFKIVGEIPNYKGSTHLFYKMEIPKGSKA